MDALKKQVGGNHYCKLKIQPIEFITQRRLEFCLGNIVKYMVRDKGNRLEDLEKAYHYIELCESRNWPDFLTKNVVRNYIRSDFFKQFKNGRRYAQVLGYAYVGNKAKAKELLRKFINSGNYSEV